MALSSHYKRVITALVLMLLLATGISAGGWVLRLLVLAAACPALYEFFAMALPRGRAPLLRYGAVILGGLLVLSQAGGPMWTLALICLALLALGLLFLFEFGLGNAEARLDAYAPYMFAFLYIPLSLQLALYLSPAEQCLVLLSAIATDTGGYYAGSLWGRKKLWPTVSPKKTWMGFFGGMGLCLCVCAAVALIGKSQNWPLPELPLWGWLIIGLLLNQASLFGDFFESALKRTLGVKDSGNLLPGHGGVLDRIDSILFVLPVYTAARLFAAS